MKRPTILIVDDDKDFLEMLEMAFRKHFIVIAEPNTENIIKIVSRIQVDILLLDVMLGTEDCRYLCKMLRRYQGINYFPILLMSSGINYLNEYAKWGADDYIQKPLTAGFLYQKINALLQKKHNGLNGTTVS